MNSIRFFSTALALSLLLTAPLLRAADDFKPAPAPAWQLKDCQRHGRQLRSVQGQGRGTRLLGHLVRAVPL